MQHSPMFPEQPPLLHPTDYFHPFPTAEHVFKTSMEEHAKYLLPLASISLSHFRPEYDVELHFVLPIEPWIEEVGAQTTAYHSYYCRKNWIGFHVSDDSKYTLAADLRYFVSEPESLTDEVPESLSEHIEFYHEIIANYHQEREKFQRSGYLTGKFSSNHPIEIALLGGHQGWGNWSEHKAFPYVERDFIDPRSGESDAEYVPLAEDGSEFEYVGWVPSWSYAYDTPFGVLLFYSHSNRVALLTFDL